MTIMKDLNNFFRKRNNLKNTQIAAAIMAFILFLNQYTDISSRSSLFGFGAIITSLSIILVVIGWILIIIPEPATTITGIIMVIIGVFLGWSVISSLLSSLGSFMWPAIIGVVVLLFIIKR